MSVRAGILNAGEYVEGESGVTQVIRYYVDGVSGDEFTKPYNALAAPGIPAYGAPHRVVPGISVVERRPLPVVDSPTKYFVDVRWARPSATTGATSVSGNYGPTEWSANGAISSEETVRDASGRVMIVSYVGLPQFDKLDINSGSLQPNRGTTYYRASSPVRAQRDIGLLEITGTRWERHNPEPVAADFGGVVNAGTWRSFPHRTVLATTMSYREQDGGYLTSYNFVFNRNGWDIEETINLDGKTPENINRSNGIGRFALYRSFNFGGYRL